MQTKHLLTGQYLVNGTKCEVSLSTDSISWRPIKKVQKNGSTPAADIYSVGNNKEIPLKQVIGLKNYHSLKQANKVGKESRIQKLKVYYAVQNENKSASRLLKLKKLSIENVNNHQTFTPKNRNKQSKNPTNSKGKDQSVPSAISLLLNGTTPSKTTTTITTSSANNKEDTSGGSAPPSCYASEGSTGHLSNLSISSSTNAGCDNNGDNKSPVIYSTAPIKNSATTEDSNTISSDSSSSCITRTTIKQPATKEKNSEQTSSSSFSSALSSSSSTSQNHIHNLNNHHRPSSSISIPLSATSTTRPDLTELSSLIEEVLELERKPRPKRLLIFVNPFGGKGKALNLFELQVRRLLDLAGIESELVVTRHANHARDTIEDPQFNIEYFDGIICVGGDGMFSELMNGLLYRYNRERILTAAINESEGSNTNGIDKLIVGQGDVELQMTTLDGASHLTSTRNESDNNATSDRLPQTKEQKLVNLKKALGGIGKAFLSPPIPIGVIGAGSTDANSFGLLGTNDVITATLNIILGNQIKIDVCSVHSYRRDNLLRFVSTFVAYGYFGDVIRESEKLRWLGPSRYDVTGVNNLIKNRTYKGRVNILRSRKDGTPFGLDRCHSKCEYCSLSNASRNLEEIHDGIGNVDIGIDESSLEFIEKVGSFVGVNAAVTACRCPQTKKGFSPSNHLANGCADLILVRPCSRMQYIQYLVRTGWTKKSVFDLKYVEAYRCRQFEFIAQEDLSSLSIKLAQDDLSQFNADSNTFSSSSNMTKSSLSSSASSSSSVNQTTASSSSNSNSLESRHQTLSSTQRYCQSKATQLAIGNILSSWNVDGEILNEQSIRVKVNNQLLRVFGTGEPKL